MFVHFTSFTGNPVMDSFFLAGFLLLGGAVLPFVFQGFPAATHATGMILSAAGSLVGIFSAVLALVAKSPSSYSVPWVTGGIRLSLHIDGLSAFFLLPIFVIGFTAALYGYSYIHHDIHKVHKIAFHWFFFNILMLSMAAVVTAGNGLQFLVAWEGMSISSFFLVCYDYENEAVCRAGWLYFMATHIGVAFLFFFFLAVSTQSGSLDFESFRTLKSLSPAVTGGLFILILLGFGSKAGLFPMHVWLPDAHPAAPSHVSALMSGVMIKTAVYGFLRMLTFLPPLPDWCVIVIMAAGLVGAVFGITMAASQNDIKRSLAYSTVENINLIFLGIGLWLFGVNAGWPVMSGIALIGALLHVWNHALFKGLLFMGAGSVLHGTGSRLFSHLGGLLRRMPITGAMLIFGSAAIAGLPPLNGFISELYLYMSVVIMGQEASGITAFSALLILSLMILVGGLVLFVVCRLAGMALLGEPRAPEAEQAVESAPLMLFAMSVLGGLCVLIGVAPSLPLAAIGQPLRILSVLPEKSLQVLPFLFRTEWTVFALFFLCFFVVFLWIRTRSMAGRPRPSTWGCGFQKPTRRMVYSAGGFTQLAQDTLLCRCVSPKNETISSPAIFREHASFVQKISDPVFFHIFMPLFANISNRASSLHRLQAGRLNIYLLYIFIATILLLGLDVYQNL
jgi:formate hydrogenlyase subunit 3/multisubunit Na+/H+ antiporter MnhD subunit